MACSTLLQNCLITLLEGEDLPVGEGRLAKICCSHLALPADPAETGSGRRGQRVGSCWGERDRVSSKLYLFFFRLRKCCFDRHDVGAEAHLSR